MFKNLFKNFSHATKLFVTGTTLSGAMVSDVLRPLAPFAESIFFGLAAIAVVTLFLRSAVKTNRTRSSGEGRADSGSPSSSEEPPKKSILDLACLTSCIGSVVFGAVLLYGAFPEEGQTVVASGTPHAMEVTSSEIVRDVAPNETSPATEELPAETVNEVAVSEPPLTTEDVVSSETVNEVAVSEPPLTTEDVVSSETVSEVAVSEAPPSTGGSVIPEEERGGLARKIPFFRKIQNGIFNVDSSSDSQGAASED